MPSIGVRGDTQRYSWEFMSEWFGGSGDSYRFSRHVGPFGNVIILSTFAYT